MTRDTKITWSTSIPDDLLASIDDTDAFAAYVARQVKEAMYDYLEAEYKRLINEPLYGTGKEQPVWIIAFKGLA